MNSELRQILDSEYKRQHETLDLIPSENYSSKAVRDAVGSVAMHKYSEGYPNARYYEGNEYIDQLELLCIEMVKKVFKLPNNWGVNVQPLAGSNANLAVYNALLDPGDKILSMFLSDGGHLSHGWSLPDKDAKQTEDDPRIYRGGARKVNIVSKIYNVVQYKTNPDTNLFDYDFLEKLAVEEKPKLIITGGTAYVRNIDYKRIREIADKVGAYYLTDVAHEAGLIAGEALESPVGISDIVTFTTHKTLRGPKGAAIMGKQEIIDKVNKSIIPGMQGGPHNGTIAGITQALFEADTNEFREYSAQIIKNAKALAEELKKFDFKLVSDGTDKHLILIDLRNKGIAGKYFARALSKINLIANMNTIPYDTGSPLNPSGLRIGTPTITTRGMKESEMLKIAEMINSVLDISLKYKELEFKDFDQKVENDSEIRKIKSVVLEICKQYPLSE